MLNPTPPSEVVPQRVIQIPATEVLPQAQPVIAVGEVLKMMVRSNVDGQGQLYFRGVLLAATLPETLAAGDKIFAKVTEAGTQLVLKLLETQRPGTSGTASGGGGTQNPISGQLQQFIKESSTPSLRFATALPYPDFSASELHSLSGEKISEAATTNPQLKPVLEVLAELADALESNETLADPRTSQSTLLDAAGGKIAPALKQAAASLKQLLADSAPPDTRRFLSALKEELSDLLERSVKDNDTSRRQIDVLINSLTEEIKVSKQAPEKERQILKDTLRDLQTARESPEQTLSKLETSLTRLKDAALSTSSKPVNLDPKTKAELHQIAARLEQMASAQDNLAQLNPVMHALGEPALILFPFLAQGLLSHSQISIDSGLDRKGSGGGRGRDYDEGEYDGDSSPYQRIQVSVPLPSMGPVHVDIAHRKDEILVRFSVSDPEAASFLTEKLEHLGTTLRNLNFARTELMTHVGEVENSSPLWANGSEDESVIA